MYHPSFSFRISHFSLSFVRLLFRPVIFETTTTKKKKEREREMKKKKKKKKKTVYFLTLLEYCYRSNVVLPLISEMK